jgi:hypothetical protein
MAAFVCRVPEIHAEPPQNRVPLRFIEFKIREYIDSSIGVIGEERKNSYKGL